MGVDTSRFQLLRSGSYSCLESKVNQGQTNSRTDTYIFCLFHLHVLNWSCIEQKQVHQGWSQLLFSLLINLFGL